MIINDEHKKLYNCFLKHYRNGQPFKYRKDFTNFDPILFVDLCKVYNFLEKFPHVDWDEYFGAPRHLHPDEKCPPLSFFKTRVAIKSYSLYKQKQEAKKPESQLDSIRESLRFIAMFCVSNKIPLKKYIYHKTGLMYTWIKHYREHRINIYSLMELGDVMSILNRLQEDEKELYAKDLIENIGKFKILYFNSPETKTFVKAASKKIEDFLNIDLKKSENCVSI